VKLYTRPRTLRAHQVRPGDQLAVWTASDTPIESEARFLDADLEEEVRWTVVHGYYDSSLKGIPLAGVPLASMAPHRPVIVREVIELDPWSYVRTQ